MARKRKKRKSVRPADIKIPEDLKPLFVEAAHSRAWLARYCGVIQGAKSTFTIPTISRDFIVTALRAIEDHVRVNLPHKVCQTCLEARERRSFCKCQGKGWLSRADLQ